MAKIANPDKNDCIKKLKGLYLATEPSNNLQSIKTYIFLKKRFAFLASCHFLR